MGIQIRQKENKIYYYCRRDTALELILPKKQLLLSPILNTNDPREFKNLLFTYGIAGDVGNFDLFSHTEKHNKLLKEDCKVLCFSKNFENLRGSCLSKMWAQYAENHKGVCLEIDSEKFIQENPIASSQFFKPITYTDAFPNPTNIDMSTIATFGEENFIKKTFRFENLDLFFFTKTIEWKSEAETRLVYFSTIKEKEYCSIKNSLQAIHLGLDFHDSYVIAVQALVPTLPINKMYFQYERLVSRQIC